MQALAAGGLDETLESFGGEPVADDAGGGGEIGKDDTGTWIEIEDQAIGMIEIVGARAPRMDFEDARLDEGDQAVEAFDADDLLVLVRVVDLTSHGCPFPPRHVSGKSTYGRCRPDTAPAPAAGR